MRVQCIDQGYAFYWGTSEWSAEQIEEAWRVAERLDLIGPGEVAACMALQWGTWGVASGWLEPRSSSCATTVPTLQPPSCPAAAMEQPQYNIFHRKRCVRKVVGSPTCHSCPVVLIAQQQRQQQRRQRRRRWQRQQQRQVRLTMPHANHIWMQGGGRVCAAVCQARPGPHDLVPPGIGGAHR